MKTKSWIAAVLSLGCAGVFAAGNLLPNGDFKNGLAGWKTFHPEQAEVQTGSVPCLAVHFKKAGNSKILQMLSEPVKIGKGNESRSAKITFRRRGYEAKVFLLLLKTENGKLVLLKNQDGKKMEVWVPRRIKTNWKQKPPAKAENWVDYSRTITLPEDCDTLQLKIRATVCDPVKTAEFTDFKLEVEKDSEKKPFQLVFHDMKKETPSYAVPVPGPGFQYGVKDSYLTRDGKPYYYIGVNEFANQWQVGASWLAPIGEYSMISFRQTEGSSGSFSVAPKKETITFRYEDWEPSISSYHEFSRLGAICQIDAGCYSTKSYIRSPFREKMCKLLDFMDLYGHYYSWDHNTERGRRLMYNNWYSQLRYLKNYPIFAYEIYNELGYSPRNERVYARFRTYAEEKYQSLGAANKAWGTSFQKWNEVFPPHDSGKRIFNAAGYAPYYEAQIAKFPDMYTDWLRFIQQDLIVGLKKMREEYRTLNSSPLAVDARWFRTRYDGFAALDIDLLNPVVDMIFVHESTRMFDYRNRPADPKSVHDVLNWNILPSNFARTNSKHPFINPEDIHSFVSIPGNGMDAARKNCLAQFPEQWKFKLYSDVKDLPKNVTEDGFDDRQWGTIPVPGAWDNGGKYAGKQGIGCYRVKFTIPQRYINDFEDGTRNFFLYGQGVAQSGDFYVNGTKVGTLTGPRAWKDIYKYDIGRLLRFGKENTLVIIAHGTNYDNGIRGPVTILPQDMLDTNRLPEKEDYAMLLWSYLAEGNSGVVLWLWDSQWRPFMSSLEAELRTAAPIVLPHVRDRKEREVAILIPYLFMRGLPSSYTEYFQDYIKYYAPLYFGQRPINACTEPQMRKLDPEKVPLAIYTVAGQVHQSTYDAMKNYVENGGTALITFDSFAKTFDRFEKTDIDQFAGIRRLGPWRGARKFQTTSGAFEVVSGDMLKNTGVEIALAGAEAVEKAPSGIPVLTRVKRGKGTVYFLAVNPGFDTVWRIVGKIAEMKKISVTMPIRSITQTEKELPYLRGGIWGDPDRFVAYVQNFGGIDRMVTFDLPASLAKAEAYRVRDIRNPKAPEQIISRKKIQADGFTVKAKTISPVALLFEPVDAPAAKIYRDSERREKLIQKISELKKNPENTSGKPKALMIAAYEKNTENGKLMYPQVALALEQSGYDVYELPYTELTPEKLREFKIVFLGEQHRHSARFIREANYPFVGVLEEYIRNGGSFFGCATSAYGASFNGYQQLNHHFGSRFFNFRLLWGKHPRNAKSCGYNDPRQIKAVDFADHPVTKGVRAVQFFSLPVYDTKPFNPKKPVYLKPVIFTSAEDELISSAPLMLAGDYGKGRAVFCSDIMWLQPTRVEACDNLKLIDNIIDYLGRKDCSADRAKYPDRYFLTLKDIQEIRKEEGR